VDVWNGFQVAIKGKEQGRRITSCVREGLWRQQRMQEVRCMRKALVLLLALGLVGLLVAGCGKGENTAEAKAKMSEGDQAYQAAKDLFTKLQQKQSELGGSLATGDYSKFTGPAGEALEKEVTQSLADIEAKLREAEGAYEEILGMEGLKDYKDYAELMLQATRKRQEMLPLIKTLLEELKKMVMAGAAGQKVDFTALLQREELKKVTDLGSEADSLEKQADKVKADKKL
jgi:hypothetical protein